MLLFYCSNTTCVPPAVRLLMIGERSDPHCSLSSPEKVFWLTFKPTNRCLIMVLWSSKFWQTNMKLVYRPQRIFRESMHQSLGVFSNERRSILKRDSGFELSCQMFWCGITVSQTWSTVGPNHSSTAAGSSLVWLLLWFTQWNSMHLS